ETTGAVWPPHAWYACVLLRDQYAAWPSHSPHDYPQAGRPPDAACVATLLEDPCPAGAPRADSVTPGRWVNRHRGGAACGDDPALCRSVGKAVSATRDRGAGRPTRPRPSAKADDAR